VYLATLAIQVDQVAVVAVTKRQPAVQPLLVKALQAVQAKIQVQNAEEVGAAQVV
jgi:hypothetical protein